MTGQPYSQLETEEIDLTIETTDSTPTPNLVPKTQISALDYFKPENFWHCTVDWPEPVGSCLQFWRAGKCCGQPEPTLRQSLYCCLSWAFCSSCNLAKLFASSQGNPRCSLINHCCIFFLPMLIIQSGTSIMLSLVAWAIYTFFRASIRLNNRIRAHVGQPSFELGDFLLTCCPFTSSCELLQECRFVEPKEWDFIDQLQTTGFSCYENECTVFYRPPSVITASENHDLILNGLDASQQPPQQLQQIPVASPIPFAQPVQQQQQQQPIGYPMMVVGQQPFVGGQPAMFVMQPQQQPQPTGAVQPFMFVPQQIPMIPQQSKDNELPPQ